VNLIEINKIKETKLLDNPFITDAVAHLNAIESDYCLQYFVTVNDECLMLHQQKIVSGKKETSQVFNVPTKNRSIAISSLRIFIDGILIGQGRNPFN